MVKITFFMGMLLALAITCILADQVDPNYNFDKFVIQFEKNYDAKEMAIHRPIFEKNYAEILQLNNEGHHLEVNTFLDWTPEQLAAINNYNPASSETPLSSRPLMASDLLGATVNPISYDWRTLFRVTEVKNQGSCGSCWAFSTIAQYESAIAIETNGTLIDLSEQFLVECNTRNLGCNGGNPEVALNFVKTANGLPLDSQYPYKAVNPFYGSTMCADTKRVKVSNPYTVNVYTTLTATNLISDLIKYGPITVGVKAGQASFMSAGANGLISCVISSPPLDHAVLLVGYNSSHWFIKNSWGPGWGNNGFAYISRSADCGIKSLVTEMRVSSGTPPAITTTTLTISMIDSKGDGWNGNAFALRQNGWVVAQFGADFTTGASKTVTVTLNGRENTELVVQSLGTGVAEVGFTIKSADGTVLFSQAVDGTFTATTLFTTFCPLSDCQALPTTKTYYLYATDSYGDGWNGHQIAFSQNGNINFIMKMQTGKLAGPYTATFIRGVSVDISVYVFGTWSEELGFYVLNDRGYKVFEKLPKAFTATTLFGGWIPDSLNESPIDGASAEMTPPVDNISSSEPQYNVKALLISTSVLAVLCGIFLVALVLGAIQMKRLRNLSKDSGNCVSTTSGKEFVNDSVTVKSQTSI